MNDTVLHKIIFGSIITLSIVIFGVGLVFTVVKIEEALTCPGSSKLSLKRMSCSCEHLNYHSDNYYYLIDNICVTGG